MRSKISVFVVIMVIMIAVPLIFFVFQEIDSQILRQKFCFISGFTISLVFVFSLVFSKKITMPLEKLYLAAKKLEEKSMLFNQADYFDQDTGREELEKLDTGSNDETSRLVHIFLNMHEIMQKNINELYLLNQEFEIRVAERTAKYAKANKELKKAKQAAEAAAQSKSDFLANMSHEIRTPMNGVIAAADLALGRKTDPKVEKYLKIIQSSGYSLISIINDILDFSKIEAGKLEIESKPFNLNELFYRVADLFASRAYKKGIELIIDIEPEIPETLIGDPLRLQQIITNLGGNAIKFTPEKGSVSMGVRQKSIDQEIVILEFFVKDTGMGIEPEYINELFQPFTQVDTPEAKKQGGTGLGLTICKQLTEMMDGRIWVESEVGQGTTFRISMPFYYQAETKKEKLIIPDEIKGIKVLIVDDNKDNRKLLENFLNIVGCQSRQACSGKEALKYLKTHKYENQPFDLIVIDWMMPGLDGIETSKIIREQYRLDIPIIMLTAFEDDDLLKDAQKAGINVFLSKPVDMSDFFNAVKNVFTNTIPARDKQIISTRMSIYMDKLKGKKILVAEDNITNQEIAKEVLSQAEIEAVVVSNGRQAVEAVFAASFDAVLMDIQMPEMDGYEATRQIRKNPEFRSFPIIAITASAMKGDQEKCMKTGMNAYISKPLNQEELFRTLAECLELKIPEKTNIDKHSILPDALPGIDVLSVLKNAAIGRSPLKRILIEFMKNNENTSDSIWNAYERKEWKTIRSISHMIKGSSSSIGAFNLHQAACNLEKASKMNDSFDKSFINNFESAMLQVLHSIKTLDHNS
ncbi:response regulator [Desulfonema limicola]|nr:response regulator [Desulfonema limicola]